MENYVSDNDMISVTAPYAVVAGAGLLVGGIFGVAATTAAISATVTIATEGAFSLVKVAGVAWTAGMRVFWDDTAKNVTTVATANFNVGRATVAQASGNTTGIVLLGSTTPAGT